MRLKTRLLGHVSLGLPECPGLAGRPCSPVVLRNGLSSDVHVFKA